MRSLPADLCLRCPHLGQCDRLLVSVLGKDCKRKPIPLGTHVSLVKNLHFSWFWGPRVWINMEPENHNFFGKGQSSEPNLHHFWGFSHWFFPNIMALTCPQQAPPRAFCFVWTSIIFNPLARIGTSWIWSKATFRHRDLFC